MSERAEILFKKLQNRKAIGDLVGKAEDGDFDCKEWHNPADKMKGSIAKAACGFANATGGVIVIGMSARSTGQNMPDLVIAEKPVADISAVKSDVLDIILKQVDPGIKGVQVHIVQEKHGSQSGFVLVYIPELDGSPQRSRVDKEFYVRIASGTIPMAYFQIEDRFGRRPHPRLVLELKHDGTEAQVFSGAMVRKISVLLGNQGRGLARFPAVRYEHNPSISLPNGFDRDQPIWSGSYADTKWKSLRGGADAVVYPGETLRIATLIQVGKANERGFSWLFPQVTIRASATCDGMPEHLQTFQIDEFKI